MAELFHDDYPTARARFRQAARDGGFTLSSHPILGGDAEEDLTLDVAVKGSAAPRRAVVVSSGTHGVEGYFGSAVQLALLDGPWKTTTPADGDALVMLHGINPHGFAHKRRVDHRGVDLNRNFLSGAARFEGAPDGYRALDPVLNPDSAPGGLDPFLLRAAAFIARHGYASVKDAIAGGQYAFPRGLFFGGHEPSPAQLVLQDVIVPMLGTADRVIHLDLHTGTGRWGTYVCAVDLPKGGERLSRLEREFGAEVIQGLDPSGVLYTIQGALGGWLQAQMPRVTYDCLLAEFGTYNVIKVLTTLRFENRVVQHAPENEALRAEAARRMLEAFCPADPGWRSTTVERALAMTEHAQTALF